MQKESVCQYESTRSAGTSTLSFCDLQASGLMSSDSPGGQSGLPSYVMTVSKERQVAQWGRVTDVLP